MKEYKFGAELVVAEIPKNCDKYSGCAKACLNHRGVWMMKKNRNVFEFLEGRHSGGHCDVLRPKHVRMRCKLNRDANEGKEK